MSGLHLTLALMGKTIVVCSQNGETRSRQHKKIHIEETKYKKCKEEPGLILCRDLRPFI